MEFIYSRLDNCILFDKLKNEEISKTLAYMLDFKEHENLVVIPKPHSIEISNAEICIAVIFYVGFEREEYEAVKVKNNFHIVVFESIMLSLCEFEKLPLKFIDYTALFFMSLARTEDKKIREFLSLMNLRGNNTVYHLDK
ncbi:hypothetical protein [Flavobacterium restrictum]|uniref:Uncharacterized protein n=1 Tax=Flavobacterium restrictum TaxID=2594428 RepID=A0A553DU42_9FLAO|nr:hypothetical protein [Flavobacterium restrictum]TRX36281.1 hypothetical protein FNW21_14050 [Flavobacterium restrictum]